MNFSKWKFTLILAFSFFGFLLFTSSVSASTNISATSTEHWAWNDVVGWIDLYSTGNVNVSSTQLTGYASSSVGYIAFDCATSPSPPAGCGTTYSNWKITNDGSGNLSGFAWSEAIGWISFYCGDLDPTCTSFNYRVTIDSSSGNFSGWAWNDVVGWISFNCNNSGIGDTCATSNYKVKTSWTASAITGTLLSAIFDTGVSGGAAFNSIMWKCDSSTSTICQPAGTAVKFQFSSATTTTGFPTPIGPGGTSLSTDTYNPTGSGTPIALARAYHNNHRYFRYKIILESNYAHTASPRVDDVIINWSP